VSPRAAEALADPAQYPNLFPDLALGLKAEVSVLLCRCCGAGATTRSVAAEASQWRRTWQPISWQRRQWQRGCPHGDCQFVITSEKIPQGLAAHQRHWEGAGPDFHVLRRATI